MRSVRELARFAARAAQVTYPTGTTSSLPIAPAASLLQRRVGVAMSAPASVDVDAYKVGDSTNIKWHEGSVDSATREKAMNQKGCVLWFTGLSGSGKVRQPDRYRFSEIFPTTSTTGAHRHRVHESKQ